MRNRHVYFMVVVVPVLAVAGAWAAWSHRAPGWAELVAFASSYAIANLGIGVGYHRYFTHKGFRSSAWVARVLAIMGSTAGQGPVVYWTALHRMHHAQSDRDGDPHSPVTGEGSFLSRFWHAHVGWQFVHGIPNPNRWTPELLRDETVMSVNRHYATWFVIGLIAPGVVVGAATHSVWGFVSGVVWGGLVRTVALQHVIWSINSVCHVWGSRPHATKDASTNNAWLALPSFGESWHNNHHAFPSAAVHGLERWQVDVSGSTIRLMAALRLVTAVQLGARLDGEEDAAGASET